MLAETTKQHRVPLTLCGEMAGRPLEAMCLIGLGFRTLSMAPASIGPVKTMILSLDAGEVTQLIEKALKSGTGSLRKMLESFAQDRGVEV
jgi:phosphotransferase system enzyme I (PtsP)